MFSSVLGVAEYFAVLPISSI